MNTPVKYDLAKLLKEKRFGMDKNNYIQSPRFYDDTTYFEYNLHVGKKYNPKRGHLGADTIEDFEAHLTMMDNSLDNICLAPTISEVVMWLYEKHDIWISVVHKRHSQNKHFAYNIKQANGIETYLWGFNSPTEAYEAAIEYTLNNLL